MATFILLAVFLCYFVPSSFQLALYKQFIDSDTVVLAACPEFGTEHAKVVAKQDIGESVLIPYLNGYFAEVKSNQFEQHFSQLKIDDRNHIMLGPLSFVNHSCNPNALFTRQDYDADVISLRTIRRIAHGEEIRVNYSKRYFGGACLCMSMNLNGSELVFKWPVTHLESQIIQIAYQRWLPDFAQTFEFHDMLKFNELIHGLPTLMESTKVAEAQYIENEPLGNVLDYCCSQCFQFVHNWTTSGVACSWTSHHRSLLLRHSNVN